MLKIMAIQLIIVVAILSGWIMNIVKLTQCDFQPSYKAEIIHVIGIIPVVGMVTGWMDFGE